MPSIANPSYFQGKKVAVTGGSSGIGKALVFELLNAGAHVATCSRNQNNLYVLETEAAGRPLYTMVADVSVEKDCEFFIRKTIENLGGIDILINNAGISMRAEFRDVELDTIRKLMDINFWGTVYCTKYSLPHIVERRGDIVGVSSIAGYRGLPGRTGYSASKSAMQGFMEALRTELLADGVNVCWVSPGFTASNIRNVALNKDGKPQGESPMDEGNLVTAEECAVQILNTVSARKRSNVMTFQGKQTVFINKFFPSLADRLVRNFFYKDNKLVK